MFKEHILYALYHPLSGNYIRTSDEIGMDLGGDTPELHELNFWSSELDDKYLELESVTIPITELEIHEFNCNLKVIMDTEEYIKLSHVSHDFNRDLKFEEYIKKNPIQEIIGEFVPDPLIVDFDDIADFPRDIDLPDTKIT